MNDKIRNLQKNCEEWHLEASALLSKADPSGDEREKGLGLIDKIKAAKAEIENEHKRLTGLDDLKGLKMAQTDAETSFQFSGKTPGTDGFFLGSKEAGRIVIDSFGTVLEDVGEGIFGSKEKFENVQTRDYKRAFTKMIRSKGSFRSFHGSELKTIQEGMDDQGGAWVPADVIMRLIQRKPTPTRLAGMVTNITTGRDRVVLPRVSYSADDLYSTAFRASWTGEVPNSDTAEDVDTTGLSGNLEIPVFTAMLSAPVTNDQVEDNGFPILPWLEDQLRIVIDLLKDNMILNGTGHGQPLGFMVNPGGSGQPAVIQNATNNKVFGDDLINACMAIPEQYDDGLTWGFNKTVSANNLRKIKDAGGRYIWNMGADDSGLVGGRPKAMVGYPFVYSGFFANMTTAGTAANTDGSVNVTTGANWGFVGDPLGYDLINRLGITLQVLRETRAKRNQVELLARVRFGGKCAEPWRLRVLQGKGS